MLCLLVFCAATRFFLTTAFERFDTTHRGKLEWMQVVFGLLEPFTAFFWEASMARRYARRPLKGLCTEAQARYLLFLTRNWSDREFDRFVGLYYRSGSAWRRQGSRQGKLRHVSRESASRMIRVLKADAGIREALAARGFEGVDASVCAVVRSWMRGCNVRDPMLVPDGVVRQALLVRKDRRLARLALDDCG